MLAKLAHAVCAGQAAAASPARQSVDTLDAECAGVLESRARQLDPEGAAFFDTWMRLLGEVRP